MIFDHLGPTSSLGSHQSSDVCGKQKISTAVNKASSTATLTAVLSRLKRERLMMAEKPPRTPADGVEDASGKYIIFLGGEDG